MAESGLGQTIYGFVYFYRNQSPLMGYTDILCLKMLYSFVGKPRFINISKIINDDELETIPKEIT